MGSPCESAAFQPLDPRPYWPSVYQPYLVFVVAVAKSMQVVSSDTEVRSPENLPASAPLPPSFR